MSDNETGKAAIKSEDLHVLVERMMTKFGRYSIEWRGVPNRYDGLKPVTRRILWAMYDMGARPGTNTKKCAMITGDVIGKYHPHGDDAAYDALVGLSQNWSSVPTVEGQGNFGTHSDRYAANRYTEARLNDFAIKYMLPKEYLSGEVTKFIANYSGEMPEPVVLPALVPFILLNQQEGISVGITNFIPPFHPKGVLKLTRMALKGKKITARTCLKKLRFNFYYKSVCVSPEADLMNFYKTGVQTLRFTVPYEVDPMARRMTITGLPVRANIEKMEDKIRSWTEVEDFTDQCDTVRDMRYIVQFKKHVATARIKQLSEEIAAALTESVNCVLSITTHEGLQYEDTGGKWPELGDDVKQGVKRFFVQPMASFMEDWTKWRIELERRMLKYRLTVLRSDMEFQKLMLLATNKLAVIVSVLKQKTDNPDKLLASKLKITVEQAKIILDRPVRSLSRLSQDKIKAEMAKLKKTISETKSFLKAPAKKILLDINDIDTSDWEPKVIGRSKDKRKREREREAA